MTGMILVTGAAGYIKRRVLVMPPSSGFKVRALVQNRSITLNFFLGNMGHINKDGLRDLLKINLGFVRDTTRDY